MTSVVELEPYVDNSVSFFMKRIEEYAQQGMPMNMAQWFQWYAFDVIGELTFSTRFGFLKEAKDIGGTTKIIDMYTAYCCFVGQIFSFHWLLLGNPLVKLLLDAPSAELNKVRIPSFLSTSSQLGD